MDCTTFPPESSPSTGINARVVNLSGYLLYIAPTACRSLKLDYQSDNLGDNSPNTIACWQISTIPSSEPAQDRQMQVLDVQAISGIRHIEVHEYHERIRGERARDIRVRGDTFQSLLLQEVEIQ